MGLTYSTIFHRLSLCTTKTSSLILTGLPGSGKSVLLSRLKLGSPLEIPLVSKNNLYSSDPIHQNKILLCDQKTRFYAFDISKRIVNDSYTDLRAYFKRAIGIIYVIDACDRTRLGEARENLHLLLEDKKLSDCIFLVLANKTDDKGADCEDEMRGRDRFGRFTTGGFFNDDNTITEPTTVTNHKILQKNDPSNKVATPLSPERLVSYLELEKYQDSIWKVVKCSGLTEMGVYEGLDWLSRTVERQRLREGGGGGGGGS